MPAKSTDDEFIAAWRLAGGAAGAARILKTDVRTVAQRRRSIERRHGMVLETVNRTGAAIHIADSLPKQGIRRLADGIAGTVIVFSDAHFWPGVETVAYNALLTLIRELKPVMIVANGDILDGARISRHDRIGWEDRPKLKDELDCVRERMDAIRTAHRAARHVMNLGNHDIRFARYLAINAPEVEGLLGTELADHIPHWEIGWSLAVNGHTMIKHRQAGGVHAVYQNTLKAGWNMVTGHLHRLMAYPWGDYSGIRWGVDSGTLANTGPESGPFFYAEDSARPWSEGFAILTFNKQGELLEPEFCRVIGGRAYWRAKPVV